MRVCCVITWKHYWVQRLSKLIFPRETQERDYLYGYLIYLLKNDPVNTVSSTSYRLLTAANRRTARRFRFRQSATKWVETLHPKLGFFYVLLTSKGGNIAFLPHPLRAMLCPCSVATYRKQHTPQLWMEGTGEGCRFFCSPKLPYLSTMSQQFFRRLSESQKWPYVL